MNATLPNPMREAIRLTRDGRLAEATALLQRSLLGDAPPGGAAATPQDAARPAAGRPARIIDIDPATGEALPSGPDDTADARRHRSADAWRAAGSGQTVASLLPGLLPKALRDLPGLNASREALQPTAPLPEGAQFLTRSFTGQAGSLGYKLYIPGGFGSAAMPLVVMLHGCTQSPDDFAAGTRMNRLADEHGCVIAYPCQTRAANAQKCWNWFSPSDQQRDQGEPALIAGITRQIARDHAVDRQRVYIAGLSAGGAAAAVMGMAYPDLYAAIGVHSGLACGAARDIPSAFAAMRQGATAPHEAGPGPAGRRMLPTIVFHADKDGTVHPRNGDQVIAQSAASDRLRSETHRGRVPGGHAYTRTTHIDASGQAVLEQWLVHGGGHAWSGGSSAGSYTDPRGPDASREMLRFFLQHALRHDAG